MSPHPQLLHLSEEQRAVILQQVTDTVKKLLAVRFNRPDEDQERIRRHAELTGTLEAYQFLLDFDSCAMELFEQNLNSPDDGELA